MMVAWLHGGGGGRRHPHNCTDPYIDSCLGGSQLLFGSEWLHWGQKPGSLRLETKRSDHPPQHLEALPMQHKIRHSIVGSPVLRRDSCGFYQVTVAKLKSHGTGLASLRELDVGMRCETRDRGPCPPAQRPANHSMARQVALSVCVSSSASCLRVFSGVCLGNGGCLETWSTA